MVAIEGPIEVKTSKSRSIQGSVQEPVFVVAKPQNLRKRLQSADDGKGLRRRNFDANQETTSQKPVEKSSTIRPPVKARPTRGSVAPIRQSSTAFKPLPSTTAKPDKSVKITSRFKGTRKPTTEGPLTTAKSRRQFTVRSTSENVLVTTSEAPSSTKASLKRVPFTRGNFRPNPTKGSINNDGNVASEEENYPEHFKLLLKNKEPEPSQENDKAILKKPLKPYRPSSVNKTTKSPIKTFTKNTVAPPSRPNAFVRSSTTTTTEVPSSSTDGVASTTKRAFRRPRPTDRTKTTVASTLQEPPAARSTLVYATRSPVRQQQVPVEDTLHVNTQADAAKQIDPPLREYFPRTSAVRKLKVLQKPENMFIESDL